MRFDKFTQMIDYLLERYEEIARKAEESRANALEAKEAIKTISALKNDLKNELRSFASDKEKFRADYEKYAALSAKFSEVEAKIDDITSRGFRGEKGEKGERGEAAELISDEAAYARKTYSSIKIDSLIAASKEESEETFLKQTEADEKFMGKGEVYSKTQSDERYLEKTQANLFIQKDKFNVYADEAPLPAGDMNSKEYWVKIKPGFYWFNSDTGGYVNKPVNYGHFLVLRHPESSDLQVLCFEYPSHRIFHFWANGAESGGWVDINQSIGVGQTYKDVKNERAVGVTYTNTTGRPIKICVGIEYVRENNGPYIKLLVNGVVVIQEYGMILTVSATIPPLSTYKVESHGGPYKLVSWLELR